MSDLLLVDVPLLTKIPTPLSILDFLIWKYFHTECEKNSVVYPEILEDVNISGLLTIAAVARNAGFSVEVLRPQISNGDSVQAVGALMTQLREALSKASPKAVGVGPYTCTYPLALSVLAAVKNHDSNILTIMGGHHATFLDEEVLSRNPEVDVVARRAGEQSMIRLLNASQRKERFKSIPDIAFRDECDRIVRTSEGSRVDLSSEPMPAYDLCLRSQGQIPRIVNVSVTRGCPYNCTFCSERRFWGNPCSRPVAHILRELSLLNQEHGIRFFRVTDDTLIWNRKLFRELSRGIASEKLDIEFLQVWSRAEHLSQWAIRQLRSIAKVVDVCIGIESADPAVLRVMRKGLGIGQVRAALNRIRNIDNLIPTGFWIVGHPGSAVDREKASSRQVLHLMRRGLCVAMETSVFTPYPGTDPFEDPERYGVRILSQDWSRYRENPPPFPPVSCLANFSAEEVFDCYVDRVSAITLQLAMHLGLSVDTDQIREGWERYKQQKICAETADHGYP
jgi:anaerobic magnesium-protoporphyrin IX monomethyl ester cyclase